MEQIKVGDTLYREMFNRQGPNGEINECRVNKIGNKYLYTDNGGRYPINKTTLKYEDKEYSQRNFQLYRTKEEIKLKQKYNKLYSTIQNYFDRYTTRKATLEQLIEIAKILEIPTTTTNQ